MKITKKTLIMTNIVCFLPIFFALFFYSCLPERVPVHWDIHGNADAYLPKFQGLFVLPLVMLGINNLLPFLLNSDPRNKNLDEKLTKLIMWIIPLLSLTISFLTFSQSLGYNVSIDVLIFVIIALIFMAVGNYLPKADQSYTVGIRLPWTLADEENWYKTHQLAGKIWVGSGFVMLVLLLLGQRILLLIVMLVSVLVPVIYSYILYRKKG